VPEQPLVEFHQNLNDPLQPVYRVDFTTRTWRAVHTANGPVANPADEPIRGGTGVVTSVGFIRVYPRTAPDGTVTYSRMRPL
jgi:hypothetical protein